MYATLYRPFMETRASRGFVRGISLTTTADPGTNVVNPPNNYDLLNRMVRNDEIISTAFDTTVDVATRNGYDVIPVKKAGTERAGTESKSHAAVTKLFDLNYPTILDTIIYNMLYYGDCFLELVRDKSGQVTELHVLETTEMRIQHDKHGTVEGYWQRPFAISGLGKEALRRKEKSEGIFFPKEDVIHYVIKKISTQVYSEAPLEPIARLWSTKMLVHTYLLESYRNLPPELFIHLQGANRKQQQEFQSQLQRRKQMTGFPIVTAGSENSSLQAEKVPFNPDGVLRILEYLREAVLMITRVPPVWVGLVNRDGANRGNSEAQIFSFETRIRKIQQKIEVVNTKELLPALDFKKQTFNFNPITTRTEKEIFQNAAVLHGMSVKPEAIIKYLERNGITDVKKDDFKDPLIMESGGNQASRNQMAPSRQGENRNVDNMKTNLDRFGRSQAGAAKTAEKDKKQR